MNPGVIERAVSVGLGQEERRTQAILHGELPDRDPAERLRARSLSESDVWLSATLPDGPKPLSALAHPVVGVGPDRESGLLGIPALDRPPDAGVEAHRGAKRRHVDAVPGWESSE